MSQFPDIFSLPILSILEDSSEPLAFVIPSPWRLGYVNPALATWLGTTPPELRGCRIEEAFEVTGAPPLGEQLDQVLQGGAQPESSTTFASLQQRDGGTMRVELRLHRVVIEGQPMVGLIARSGRSQAPQRATAHVAGRDPLTGLADRSVLLARMSALLRGDRAADQQFAVLFIDLDNFKQVNDVHGHLVGDRVLREVSRRLASCVRAGDLIGRFGGDEFVALVTHVAGTWEIQPVIERIHDALAKPIALPVGEVTLSVSVGVAEASAEHRTPEDLLQDADRSMYASKRLPR